MYQDLDRIRSLESRMRRKTNQKDKEDQKPSMKQILLNSCSGYYDEVVENVSSESKHIAPKQKIENRNPQTPQSNELEQQGQSKNNKKLTEYWKKGNTKQTTLQKHLSQKGENKKTAHQKNSEGCFSCIEAAEEIRNLKEKQIQKQEQFNREKKRMKEMVVNHVIESHRQERNQIRAKISANKIRLGQYVLSKEGNRNTEVWLQGQQIRNVKDKIEETQNKRVQFQKELDNLRTNVNNEQEQQLLFDPMVLLECQITYYIKQENILIQTLKKLQDQKNVHVKDFKRQFQQDSSKYGKPNINKKMPAWPKIGNYQLLNLLGKGGFSQVYKGFDTEELRQVACKIHQFDINWNNDAKDSYIRHAIRENNVHKQLHHPNIVTLYNTIEIDKTSFITVMEYCSGPDLSYYLKKHKCLPEEEAKLLIKQVLFGIKYLHELLPEKIIHYDLKPQNLIFHNGQLKITDFGLCKIMKLGHKYMELTSQGVGTYWYLPPECFTQNTNISTKVDMWSCGVIYYEMLYNQKPFGNNMSQLKVLKQNIITKIKDNPIKFPEKPQISEESKDFIRRCLAYKDEDRMDAAEAIHHPMFNEIEQNLEGYE